MTFTYSSYQPIMYKITDTSAESIPLVTAQELALMPNVPYPAWRGTNRTSTC